MTLLHADRFWNFLRERERIRLRRLHGRQPPWTEDEIFAQYSFTNVKRIHDRVTTQLWREFYEKHQEPHPSPITLINAAIFRYHGTIETARAVGWCDRWIGSDDVLRGYSEHTSRDALAMKTEARMSMGYRVFTSAYIVPNCGDTRAKTEVVADIVDGVASVADSIVATDYWEMASDKLCECFGVGSFMAKEILLDYVLATDWMPKDWTTWTPVGPGARRGANAVKTGVIRGVGEVEALEVCRDLFDQRETEWPERALICCRFDHDEDGSCHVHREGLPGVSLDLTDIQFQLCEFAKYEKARTGVGRPKGNFRPTIDDVTRDGG
jgi:hypothetical protein